MTCIRLLPLEGGCNFRDFGGYEAAAGATVRWGRLYRSGVLSRLTTADLAELSRRRLGVVCDLRRPDERRRDPNPAFGADVTTLAWDTGAGTSPLRDADFAASASADEARSAMRGMYERLPFVLRPRLAGAFEALSRCGDEASLVVHCSAGKDRTGLAIALVLTALGVPREAVVADYVLTNTAVNLREELHGRAATGVGLSDAAAPIRALNGFALDAVLDASPDYILASFKALEARYGTVEKYLDAELSVGATVIDRLRERYLVA